MGTNDLLVAPSVSERLRARGSVGDGIAERYILYHALHRTSKSFIKCTCT